MIIAAEQADHVLRTGQAWWSWRVNCCGILTGRWKQRASWGPWPKQYLRAKQLRTQTEQALRGFSVGFAMQAF